MLRGRRRHRRLLSAQRSASRWRLRKLSVLSAPRTPRWALRQHTRMLACMVKVFCCSYGRRQLPVGRTLWLGHSCKTRQGMLMTSVEHDHTTGSMRIAQ